MRQRYRMYESHSARLGRLVIHWVGALIALAIITHAFLEVV